MALSGLEIYKLLPKTNCKDCGFPTCLAFAMKLAQKQAELSACPHVSDEAKVALEASAAPPVRLITLEAPDHKVEVGNETVLFRHEKTFFHPAGLFVRVKDNQADALEVAKKAAAYKVEYVGMDLVLDGIAVEAASGDAGKFAACVAEIAKGAKKPLILVTEDPAVAEAGLKAAEGIRPLVYCATPANWENMAKVAAAAKAALVVRADDGDLSTLASLAEDVKGTGLEDIVMDPGDRSFAGTLSAMTQLRRLALKHNRREVGYPMITFPGEGTDTPEGEVLLAGQQIAKYGGFVVLDRFSEGSVYPLLVLRANIFTDPQKPIQVQPGVYEINSPKPEDPLMVTTNFSITYFSVANEIESSGLPGWLMVADAEGMSVLTAWAAGKFDAEIIAKTVKSMNVAEKISHKSLVIPGHVAILMGELEEELPGWDINVGPREAVDLPAYLKTQWG